MELLFSSASLLGLNYEFEFVGDTYNFRNKKDLDIQGTIYISSGSSGVIPIWTGISGVISTQRDYVNIILNGVSFGSGRLNSINFDQDVDVRKKNYTASISVFSGGNLFNITQPYYSGLGSGFSGQDLRSLESLDESFSFEVNKDKTYTYSRNLNLKLLSGQTDAHVSGLHDQAKTIASFFFSSDVSFPFLSLEYPNFYESSGRKIYTQSYDLVNAEYSFGETFTFQTGNNYIWTNNYELSLSENGETTITENGIFKGVDLTNYSAALAAFSGNFSGYYNRCSGVYSYYKGTGCTLKNNPISIKIDRDSFLGEIRYSIVLSDNPKYQQSCIWDYGHSIKTNNGVISIEENGSIAGFGVRSGKYSNVTGCFQSLVKSGLESRISGYYNSSTGVFGLTCSDTLLQESSSVSESEFEGKINYSFIFSTDSRLSTGTYTYIETNFSNTYSVPIVNNYQILGDINSEYAVGVYRGNASLGKYSYDVKLVPSGNVDINTLLLSGKARIDKSLIPSTEYFLSDASYSYDFNEKNFTLGLSFDYVKYRRFNDITI